MTIESKKQSIKLIPQPKKQMLNDDLKDVASARIEKEKLKLKEEFPQSYQESSQVTTSRIEQSLPTLCNDTLQDKLNIFNETSHKVAQQDQDYRNLKETIVSQEEQVIENSELNQKNEVQQIEGPQVKPFLFYVYGGNYPETVANGLMARGNWQEGKEEDNIEKCHLVWRPFNYPPDGQKRIDKRAVRNSNPLIYNHFEVLKGLTTKSGLIRSLKQFYFNYEQARQAGYSTFDSTPTTFLLASGIEDAEWTEFIQRYKDIQRGYAPKERIPIKHCVNNIWLVKPANANQGKGIEIFSDLDELTSFVHSRPQFTCCVVQKYIERPLLFKGRKFDIRVWALFTHKNEVFFYKNGYLRTSSDDYNLTNGNNYVHLTNNCLQKFGTNYGVHEEGNTVGFHVLQQFLDEVYPQYKISVQEHFIPRMKDLIIDSFLATKQQLNPNRRKPAFELLGYDFLIDEDFRLWMIEINTNPYFGVPNQFIANLLPKMMDDLLDIVVDPYYAPLNKPENCKTPNDFELLYCEQNSTFSQNPINLRRPYTTSVYPITECTQLVGPKAPRQDLKYLKQYKISNFQISTLSYKNQDSSVQKMNKTQKTNNRSRSLAPSKNTGGSYQQYINQNPHTSSQLQLSTIPQQQERQNRSKSAYRKNNNLVNSLANPLMQQVSSPTRNRKELQTRQSLNIRNNSTANLKETSKIVLSKTPKQGDAKKLMANNTQRTTPRSNKLQCQIAPKIRDVSKSDIMNGSFKNGGNNTTKETSSFEFQSNTSSQDKFLFKKFRDQSIVMMKDLSLTDFEKVFNQILDKLQQEKNDQQKTYENLQTLTKLAESDKLGNLQQDENIGKLVQLIIQDGQASQVQNHVVDLLFKQSEKLQTRQILLRVKHLESLITFYNKTNDSKLKWLLLRIFTNLTCIQDLQKLKENGFQYQSQKQQNNSNSQSPLKGVYGITIVKESLFKKSLQSGLLAFVLTENRDQNLMNQLNENELQIISEQLILKQLQQQTQKQQERKLSGNLDNTIKLDDQLSKILITDPEEYSNSTNALFSDTVRKITDYKPESQDYRQEVQSQANGEFPKLTSNSELLSACQSTSPDMRASINYENTQKLIIQTIDDQKYKQLQVMINKCIEVQKLKNNNTIILEQSTVDSKSIKRGDSVTRIQDQKKNSSFIQKDSKYIKNSPTYSTLKQPPSPFSNKLVLKTPEQDINYKLSSDILMPPKITPPKEKAATSSTRQPTILSNFLQSNLQQRNKQQLQIQNQNPFSHIMNHSTSSQKVLKTQDDTISKSNKQFQPILKNKNTLQTSMLKQANINHRNSDAKPQINLRSTQQSYSNFLSKKSFSELTKNTTTNKSREQSRTSNNTYSKQRNYPKFLQESKTSFKNSKTDIRNKNDEILNSINQKINDIQANLNILSTHAARRNKPQKRQSFREPPNEKINLQTFESSESNSTTNRQINRYSNNLLETSIAPPQIMRPEDYSSCEVNYGTCDGSPNKVTLEINSVQRSINFTQSQQQQQQQQRINIQSNTQSINNSRVIQQSSANSSYYQADTSSFIGSKKRKISNDMVNNLLMSPVLNHLDKKQIFKNDAAQRKRNSLLIPR